MKERQVSGKEFNCPDCPFQNGHPDVIPQINFCANCSRTRSSTPTIFDSEISKILEEKYKKDYK